MSSSYELRQTRTHQLREAAASRAADAFARTRRAIISLDSRGDPVTFSTVASEANVSHSYLYKHPELAAEIRSRRAHTHLPRRQAEGSSSTASAESLRTQLSVATRRLRAVELELRQLRNENETLRGEVLDLRRVARTIRAANQ